MADGGGGGIRLATDMRRLVDLVERETEEIVGAAVDAKLRAAFRDVLVRWPVDTGRSRRELRFVRHTRGWGVRGDAPYTGAIRVGGEHVAETRLREPLEAALIAALREVERGQ